MGGIAKDYYWSSTESNDYNAWDFFFIGGFSRYNDKDSALHVRAVRAF
jgi:hypothetical protein